MKIAVFQKIANQMFNDDMALNHFIERGINKHISKYKFGWIGNRDIQVGIEGDDFIKNQSTIRLTFDYFKTPRILRNCSKKKRNFSNR
jgi:hypothetical protein